MEKILVIVDPLRGFLMEGPLANPDHMLYIPYIESLIESGDFKKIVILKDEHDEEDQELTYLPPHCMDNTVESQIVPEIIQTMKAEGYVEYTEDVSSIDAFEDEISRNYEIFPKGSFSPRDTNDIYITALQDMQRGEYQEAHITGFVSSICVYNAVQDFTAVGFDVKVHAAGIADVPEEFGGIPRPCLFKHWEKIYNVEVIDEIGGGSVLQQK